MKAEQPGLYIMVFLILISTWGSDEKINRINCDCKYDKKMEMKKTGDSRSSEALNEK